MDALTDDQKILAALSRIERKLDQLDEIHRRLKAVEADVKRVKREVRG
jgi:hypothetical protein